jgi:hypothetical protein
MEKQHQTYTYTARSVADPDRVVTFTLDNEHLRVNLTGLLEQASTVGQSDEKPTQIKEQITNQTKPMVTKIVEEIGDPVHINDVHASLSDEHLRITLWQRLRGLRLAPIIFDMGKIDNGDAAAAFVKELEQLQQRTEHARKFFGPLDYWLGWLGMIFVIVFLLRWPNKKTS